VHNMKTITAFTSTRAEYGLLARTLKELADTGQFRTNMIVTGTHLQERFGNTISEIEKDGIPIAVKLKLPEMADQCEGPLASVTKCAELMAGVGKFLSQKRPDALMVLGDRYETLAAAQCASLMNIPIIHLHGGELSYGSQDNQFRHAITKLAHLHFCATEASAKRIKQMGEMPENVHNVGAPGVENIKSLTLFNKGQLIDSLTLNWYPKNLLITYHPDTMASEPGKAESEFREILAALSDTENTGLIFTYPNMDAGNEKIIALLEDFKQQHPERVSLHKSLGTLNYLSLAAVVDGVVGNSSSGIIEVPSLNTPTLNIGNRQKGRERAPSVFDCGADYHSVSKALTMLLKDNMQNSYINPYDGGQTSKKIASVLLHTDLAQLLEKTFHDS